MKITDAITQLQELLKQSGDLELFDSDGWSIDGFRESVNDDYGFPKDWNIPNPFALVVMSK